MLTRLASSVNVGWRVGAGRLLNGLRIVWRSPWLYVQMVVLFALPSGIAAWLTVSDLPDSAGRSAAIDLLNLISGVATPPMLMMAVASGHGGRRLRLTEAIRQGLFWLPRYVWTNLHTSVIFWVPVGALVWLFLWQSEHMPAPKTAAASVKALWFAVIAVTALYMHSRTLLAPFFAVHSHMPGTLATLESWRLSGRRFPEVFGTMLLASAPGGGPAILLVLGLMLGLGEGTVARDNFLAMLPSLSFVFVMLVRPFLIPATYLLHAELWAEERARRTEAGEARLPPLARPLLAISRWLPRLPGYLTGRRLDWTL